MVGLKREMIAAIIALAIAIVLAYVLISLTDAGSQSQSRPECLDEQTRALVLEKALEGIDLGFRNHVAHLFDIWVKDPAEQPRRAKNGMQGGISAYERARADALLWQPRIC